MRSRLPLAALLLVGLPLVGRAAPVPAGGKNNGPPIIFQVAPVEKVLAGAKGMAALVAGNGVVGMMDEAIKAKLGEKGWAGLDTKKPIVGYVTLPNKAIKGPEELLEMSGVLAIPVTTEDEFKALPERLFPTDPLVLKPVEGNKGLYAVETPKGEGRLPVRARFHNGYAYIGVNVKDEQLDATALVPVADLVKANDPGLFLLRVLMDRYPEEMVKQQSQQIDEMVAKLKESIPGEGATWTAGVLESYAALTKRMTANMKDTEESGFRLVFDEKSAEVAFESYAIPKKNTAYAKELADAKPSSNRFASLVTDKSPAAALVQLPTTSPEFRDMVQKAVEAGLTFKDKAPPPAQPIVEELLKGFGRTVKGDSIDLAAAVTLGNDGHYTGAAALTFDDASGLEKALKDALKDAPQNVKDMIKLDVEKVEGVSVHRISPPDAGEVEKNLFGSTDILVAFGPKGIYAAVGTGASDAIKAAMTAKATPAKCFDLIVNPKLLGEMVGTGNADAGKMAAQALGTDDKRVSAFYISSEGGSSLKMRVALNLKILPKAWSGVAFSSRKAPPAPN